MTRDSHSLPGPEHPNRLSRPMRRSTERTAVLAPLSLAATATQFGMDGTFIALLWAASIAWAVLASFALALRAGLRRGDWSAFRRYRYEEDREDKMDLDTRMGGHAFLRRHEEHLADDDQRDGEDTNYDVH
ncbi:MAG: hypothetical protein F4Z95_11115 [Gammaproteobacteria bacterium]|nr:hypothetical protein [Gammaproteobacteria bacterium]